MKNIILGTAGHIDHGKTTFVKALTGIDCDRLKEEKERGITIELGYANMTLPSGVKVGIVDVPGHERFVSKMVAGASGIDVVAFIVAADEGVKPQTREHLYICNLLGVRQGIVVLTKKDLVDAELLELQTDDVREFLKGSVLENAPIVPVSSVTGEGIAEFVALLDKLAETAAVKPLDRPFRLPVDDVIVIKGFGTVVRGTIVAGRVASGAEVVVLPAGLKSRIRSMQSHGEKVEAGVAGERIALNLADLGRDEIERGMVVAGDGAFRPSERLLVDLSYLPYNEKPLKPRFRCQFHVLTAKVDAEVFLAGDDKLMPGGRDYAMVRLTAPVTVSYGDPFVVRGYGIYTTLGGGRIINPSLPGFGRDRLSQDYLRRLAGGDIGDVLAIFVGEAGQAGCDRRALAGLLNAGDKDVADTVVKLKKSGVLFEDDRKQLYHADMVNRTKSAVTGALAAYHGANPLKTGMSREELMTKAAVSPGLFSLVLALLESAGLIVPSGDVVRLSSFDAAGGGGLFEKVEQLFVGYGLQPDDPATAAAKLSIDEKKLREALGSLVRSGRIVRVKDDYFVAAAVMNDTAAAVRRYFESKQLLTPQDAKELLGLSRKFMIPLLEYLDGTKLTIRVPEGRRLRR